MGKYLTDVHLADKHLARVFFEKGTNKPLDKLTTLWMDRGGLTMYASMDDIHTVAKNIDKELRKLNNKIAFEDLLNGKSDGTIKEIISGGRNAAGRTIKKYIDFASM